MLLVFVTCAGILAPSPGCREHRVPLVVDVTPAGCAAKVQEALAERPEATAGDAVARYGCVRRSRLSAAQS
ncbi:hypothetical protein [Methylobacterium gnaphalii]|uniref:HMA domain-containing protein n=1 Tax=Methylobacterium gnaphalii TaxID=1010610 RepID=A0A512JP95_9HYPH|nr:hypothetical protein [Methylobacterium gnaphalii]GEP11784.1 hypothetical protein MGN01_36290 [Methylobacterium gnaphalii]GJD69461.1 hypothetical protein MMMDOFMJ_2392 [Methylobacterium gnaphalii]GLS49581.1 hypothetical protein GCM10007885_24300 [Methylobacterium gnaphalii]